MPSSQQQQEDDDDDAMTVVTVTSDAPADVVPPPAIHHQEKQGGKFFGCCCDYRRAVLIFGTVTVIMGLLDLIFRIGNAVQPAYEPPFDDDELVQELQNLNESYRIPYLLLECMGVVFGAVSIMGAIAFSQFGTLVAILYGISLTAIVILLDLEGRSSTNEILDSYDQKTLANPIFYYCFFGVLQIIWWYPSVFFLYELRRGIMSRRTYIREEFSCCCQPY